MKKVNILVASVALAACGAAFAQQGFYVGGNVGQSFTRFNGTDFQPTSDETSSFEKTKTAYKLFVGYDINKYLAVEGGYVDFGSPKAKFSSPSKQSKFDMDESAWFAAAKGTFQVTDQFNVFGKLGVSYNKVKSSFSNTDPQNNPPGTVSKTRVQPVYGIGAEYNVTKQVGIRLEYEDFGSFGKQLNGTTPETGTGRTQTSMWSLGASYKF